MEMDYEEMRRLHPLSLAYRFVVSLPALVFVLLPLVRSPDANGWLSVSMLLLYGLFVVPLIVLRYLRFRYAVTPNEIVIRKGVVTRQHRVIPAERIQNIEIEQNLLPRLLGLARVKIETAGSAKTEGVIEYVSLEEAKAIRAIFRRDPTFEAAPAVIEAGDDSNVLYHMKLGRVLLSGVFRFSLVYILLAFSATEYLGIEPDEIARRLAGDRFERLTAAMQSSPWVVLTATVIMVVVLAWITGILTNLNRYHGFRLSKEGDRLLTRHGLLTVSEGTIPLKKVQALAVRSNLLMAAFGWYRLEIQTVGFDPKDRGYSVAAPFARLHEVERLTTAILAHNPAAELQSVSPRMIRRTFIRYAASLAAVAGTTAFFWIQSLWLLVLLPLAYILALQQYRHHAYGQDGEHLFVRRGVFRQYFWIIPIERFQVFYLTQTIFQRRLGLRSVYVDTPGAGLLTPSTVVDLPAETAARLLGELYDRFTSHFTRGGDGVHD